MIATYRDYNKLKYPLYRLNSSNWYSADGVLFLDGLILDERKMPGKSLGIRRLQSRRTKQELYPLKRAVFDIQGLLKSPTKYFIDSNGNPFIYEKTLSSLLKCYKIKKVVKKETLSLLWLHGLNYPITLERPPMNDPMYARLLHIQGEPWLLYDYVSQPVKDTYRRV